MHPIFSFIWPCLPLKIAISFGNSFGNSFSIEVDRDVSRQANHLHTNSMLSRSERVPKRATIPSTESDSEIDEIM